MASCPAAPATGLLKRYVIVRDIDGIHTKSKQELGAITAASNSALSQTGLDRVQWQHSYVVGGKTFCIYLAANEQAIRDHAATGGFPVTEIHEVTTIIDPTTVASA